MVLVNGPPQREHGEERNEAEQGPRQIIEAIRQVALQPDADDMEVFFHASAAGNLNQPGEMATLNPNSKLILCVFFPAAPDRFWTQ